MGTSSDKIKILLFGSIVNRESEKLVCSKLETLQKSKAGPFDVAFCVGKCSVEVLCTTDLPIPVYVHDTTTTTAAAAATPKEDKVSASTRRESENKTVDESKNNKSQVQQLAPNLFVLRSSDKSQAAGGIWSLSITPKKPELVVVACPWNIRVDSPTVKHHHLLDQLTHVSYTGCDLLLSHEWPQGVESCLEPQQHIGSSSMMISSFDVAHVALQARARYHVAPGHIFQQSTAFEHLAATTNTVPTRHVGRFLSLAPVTPPTTASNKKLGKFVHAIGITPLHSLSPLELQEQRPTVVNPCPYTDASYKQDHGGTATSSVTGGLSEASARRILNQERQKEHDQQHRWASKKRPRPSRQEEEEEATVPPDLNILFVHGLHQDVSGRLQSPDAGDELLMQYFATYGVLRIKRPSQHATSSFCFLEFGTHDQAKKCLEETGGQADVKGVHLTIKWGSSGKKESSAPKKHRLTESEAKDSSVVYFKLPPTVSDPLTAGESLRQWMERTLEDALSPDADDGSERITAASEPALQVQVRLPQHHHESETTETTLSFGFLEFASHAAASMALATLTGTTDGGRVLDEAKGMPSSPSLQGLYLHWAKPDTKKSDSQRDIIEDDSSGFKFERKHFPADSRQDCWFCLASQDCERHLITGVYNNCYAAMPKGPVHEAHVLLIPVKHSSQGALMDSAVAEEMEDLKTKLRQHASIVYSMDLFVFERAIQTKGGYHTHVNCIPVERGLGPRLQTTMRAQAIKVGINLRELNSDLGLKAVLSDDDDDECEGYFYAEIPIAGNEYKRFLYKHEGKSSVPLQFGREVLAAVIGKPELAHWKSCVVDKEKEAAMASAFHESFKSLVEE